MNHFLNILKGMAIGIANIIPGVSGGTMAVILGIYEQLTDAVGNFLKEKNKIVKKIILLSTIGLGAAFAILIFARVFNTYLLPSPVLKQHTYFFFFGLILGSIPLITKLHHDMKISMTRVIMSLLAFVLVIITALMGGTGNESQVPINSEKLLGIFTITEFDLMNNLWLSFCGFLSAGSMVLPGFSGSALLISLGEYNNVVSYVDNRMVIPVIFVAIGVIPGIIIFSKLVSNMLKRYPSETYYFILGLLLASNFQIAKEIWDIFNIRIDVLSISILIGFLGAFVSFYLGKVKK